MVLALLPVVRVFAADEYGVPVGGRPDWSERVLLTLTNACRTDPIGYRDRFVGPLPIAILGAYPATHPLYWSDALATTAHGHATDLAGTPGCLPGHSSCDGTAWNTRIRDAYGAVDYGKIGENVAWGGKTPQHTLRQWLIDDDPQGNPTADGAPGSGHRANIMDPLFQEIGTGHAIGANRYGHYWVQDFGGRTPTTRSRLPSAAHLFLEAKKTTFLAVWSDPAGKPPVHADLVLEGRRQSMARSLGTSGRGVWEARTDSAVLCRAYHFEFTGADGQVERYPARGELVTRGEGACISDYTGAATTRISRTAGSRGNGSGEPLGIPPTGNGVTEIFTGDGRLILRLCWPPQDGFPRTLAIPASLPRGTYSARHLPENAAGWSQSFLRMD